MFGKNIISLRRAFSTSAKRYHGGGIPGSTLPFSIKNRFKLTALFMIYFGLGSSAPFLVLRFQYYKKSQ